MNLGSKERTAESLVSVVLPVFNERPILRELLERIESALLSVGQRFEVLFVNDGSSDGTEELLDTFARESDRRRVVHLSRNFGHQAAVQAGLVPLAAIGIAASVIGAFYYIKIVKIMYFDEPTGKVTGQSDWAHHALLVVSAVFISPLGYLLTKWLGGLADAAAAALFFAV